MSGEDVFKKHRNAIVAIQTVTRYDSFGEIDVDIIDGSGFFIKGQHIMTSSSVVLFDNPNATRIPPAPVPPGPSYVRVVDIYVTVTDSQCGKSYIYKADIVGIDGAGGIALLSINKDNQWNQGLPSLKCQDSLDFYPSKCVKNGECAYTIVSDTNVGTKLIKGGLVSNNSFFSETSNFPAINLLSISIGSSFINSMVGAPLLNSCGQVIGVLQQSNSAGWFGPSSSFITPVIKAFLAGEASILSICRNRVEVKSGSNCVCSKSSSSSSSSCSCTSGSSSSKCEEDPLANLQLVIDPAGNYFRYIKGFLGIQWGLYGASTFALYPDSKYKKVQGIIITGTLLTSIGTIFRALIGTDNIVLLTDINGCPIGNEAGQISPTEVTWRLVAGDNVELTYRISSDNFSSATKVKGVLDILPPDFDKYNSGFMVSSINPIQSAPVVSISNKDLKDLKDSKDVKDSKGVSANKEVDVAKLFAGNKMLKPKTIIHNKVNSIGGRKSFM